MKNVKLNFEKELRYKLELKSNGRTTEESILLKAFKYFDLNNTGLCTENEFIKTINKIGITGFTDDDLKELFKKYDKDNSGYLNYKEFILILYPNNIINENENNNNNNNNIQNNNIDNNNYENNINENNINENNINENNISENNINENNNLLNEEKEFDSEEKILEKIRKKLSSRGIRGITSLAKTFRLKDIDNSQTIDYNEFKNISNEFRFDLTENEIQIIFLLFDRNKNGVIDYDEFIRVIRGEMNNKRKKIVEDIFNYLDINKSKEIEIEEIKSKFNAKNHPDVLNKKKTEDEILLEFIETFENTYNYLSGTENNGKVTLEEFMEYYENISLSIDDDNYFELLLNNTWGINNNESNNINNNFKDWNNKNENENENEKINENINNNLEENYNRRFDDKNNNFNQLKTKEKIENNNSNENELLNLFRNEIKKKGGRGIINLARQFRLFDENNSKTLELNEFSKIIKDLKLNLNDDEIKEIFSSFDIDKSNSINYIEFLKQLRGEMNEKRKNIVLKAFDKLDLDKSGIVELNEIKSLYNFKNNKDVLNGKKSEEEVFNEFIETFETHHNLKKGFRDKKVSKEEFIEYYNNISMSIDDDDLFIELISNSWKLNNKTKYKKKKLLSNTQDNNNNKITNKNNNINDNKINDNNINNKNLTNKNLNQKYNIITNVNNNNLNQENDNDNNIRKRNKFLNEKNQKIGNSQNAPFGTDNEPVNYSTWNNPNNMKMRFNDNFSNKKISIDPLKKLKNEIIKRGIRGIMSLRRNFMISDINHNKNINLNELKRFCNDYLINLDDEEINNLFNIYDKNGKGIINYEDLVNEIIGEMNNFRKEVVRKVFYKFNRNNLIDLDVLRKNYNAKEHPDVLNGKKKYLECLAEFLDCFEYHFSLLNNNRHSKINLNELYDFYNNISMNIDNDLYFEKMMNGVWDLKNW